MSNPIDRLGKYAITGGPGRPKGSKNRVTRMAEEFRSKTLELVAEDDYKFIKVLAEKAENGDMKAAAMVVDLLRIVMPKHIIEEVENSDEADITETIIQLEKYGFKPPNPSFKFSDSKTGKNQN
ncbi:MAG: hypothetical protein IID32_06370 [Planctomycetes bacterium]|nr:hypothetical protein [Planctomycetota bacterium]